MLTNTPDPRARLRLVGGLVATLLLALPVTRAQTAAPPRPAETKKDTAGAEIVVLDAFSVSAGFRGSLAAAAEMKQAQPVITEVIAAEDIGKLPDTSIAESLSRLPGLTTQRINSRAQAIVVRGLTGDFSTALLNGRQQVSAGGGRAVEFDQYPAELLSGVVVYKTTTPALLGQGLAGTIDMRTVSPLSHGRRSVAANFFYDWNGLGAVNPDADDTGTRYSVSYIDQLQSGKVGVAFGYARTDKTGQGEQWNAWGYPTVDTAVSASRPFVIGGAKPFVRSSELKRDGFMGVLELKPSDTLHSKIDLYYSDFAETQRLRGIEIPLWWGGLTPEPGFTASNGLITRATFRNVFGVVRNDFVKRDSEVWAGGWNLKLGTPKTWLVEADAGYSYVERKDYVLETYSGIGSNKTAFAPRTTGDTVVVSLESGTGAVFTPTVNYADPSQLRLTGPQGWGGDVVPAGQAGFLKGPRTRDELGQFKVAAKRKLAGWFSDFESGIGYSRRSKYEYEAGPGGTEGFFLALKNGATSAPLPPTIGTTSLSFIGIPGMASYDPLAAVNSGIYNLVPNPNPTYVANNWDVAEKVSLGYFQLGLDRTVGGIPLTGSLGTQVVRSEQRSTGLAAAGAQVVPITAEHDYWDIVPSLNLNFHFTERQKLRFSVARQLARQTMNDMRAGSVVSFNQARATSTDPNNSPWSGSGGNPRLEPWRSNSIDLSYEHYFKGGAGYWALAGFYKDLRSYTYNQTVLADYRGFPTGGSSVTPALFTGPRTTPQNGEGGNLRGLEATISLPGERLSDILSGFGLVVSGAYVRSSITADSPGSTTPIPGLSDKVVNTTLYYEKSGFAARVSSRYRSDYRGDIATFGPRGAVYRNLQEETVVDAQISYAFRRGALKGLTVTAQGYNLGDEPLFATQGTDGRLVQDYQRWGREFSVGVSYKF